MWHRRHHSTIQIQSGVAPLRHLALALFYVFVLLYGGSEQQIIIIINYDTVYVNLLFSLS